MLFNTYSFIFIFLPIAYLGFLWMLRRNLAVAWLSLVSLLFYCAWNPPHLKMLLGSIFFNYLVGFLIIRAKKDGRHGASRTFLVLGVACNLLLLGSFKYFGSGPALPGGWSAESLILPVGISFFTFTQLAYLVDSDRGLVPQPARPLDYLLFVSYFPHLVAGPILNHQNILPQFQKLSSYRVNVADLLGGLSIFSVGLFKKTILADHLAPLANSAFQKIALGNALHTLDAWSGALAYTFQLYYDFSGYSDMAIGLSLLFGIRLPINFNAPYRATSLIDFWRRWHVTLSRFLMNYLYIPLGGSRKGPIRRSCNLMITMMLGGLWHGFGQIYFVWGVFHGALLVLNHFFRSTRLRQKSQTLVPLYLQKSLGWTFTFVAVVIGWIIFRSPDISAAGRYLSALVQWKSGTSLTINPPSILWIVFAMAIALLAPTTQRLFSILQPALADREDDLAPSRLRWQPSFLWAIGIGIISAVAVLGIGKLSPFLYYQF